MDERQRCAPWPHGMSRQPDATAPEVGAYTIVPATGQLAATGQVTEAPTPVCIVFKSAVAAPMPDLPSTAADPVRRRRYQVTRR